MLRPPHSLLTALVSTTVVVSASVVWGGWRLTDQQRAIDEQLGRDQAESAGDIVAAGIREKLAEAGERLSGWVSQPTSALPSIEGAVVVGTGPDGVTVNPAGSLPFVPVAARPRPSSDTFAALEAIEFSGRRPEQAIAGYRALANTPEPHVRAGALLRLARVQRKLRDFAGALVTYQQLAELGTVLSDDLPAELVALDGQRSIYTALARDAQSYDVGRRILHGLDSGRWLIERGTAEMYREPFTERRPEAWQVANALSELWRQAGGRLPARGQSLFNHEGDSNVLVLWRSSDLHSAALAAFPGAFFNGAAATHAEWQLADPEGDVISGLATAPLRSVTRIIGNSEFPWTLRVWLPTPASSSPAGSRPFLLATITAVLTFVWGAAYFMARAIRREAAVATLQADFVAAVSHEFRSPLTTVRQMAEMLEDDRVTSDERRHKYYRIVAGEAARLQRLVETLLNFGKMEAGAERYRFVDVDAVALIRQVVDEIEPQARECGKAIEVAGPEVAVRVRADQSALSMALRNLIDNALKYSPEQPIVWVHCRQDDDRAAISVVDRGVGIPRAEQRTIFGKFVRGRAAIDANIKGTGVGLSMVQQIVTAHGGEIRLDSEPGRGSTFTVLLPAAN